MVRHCKFLCLLNTWGFTTVNLNLTLRKIAIWMSKNCQKLDFFFLIDKNCHFFNQIANGNFVEKNDNFCQFSWKKCQVFVYFLTVKWQFSGGSGPRWGNTCRCQTQPSSLCNTRQHISTTRQCLQSVFTYNSPFYSITWEGLQYFLSYHL